MAHAKARRRKGFQGFKLLFLACFAALRETLNALSGDEVI